MDRQSYRYALVLALFMALAGAVVAATGWYLGPPVGDLTRISGLSERDYGWRGEALGYVENQFTPLGQQTLMQHGAGGGIVVFGDSFSAPQPGNVTWLNILHEQSGYPITLVDIATMTEILDYLQSDAYRQNPPVAVIIEMAERTVFRRTLPLFETEGCEPVQTPATIAMSPVPVERRTWRQRQSFSSFDELMSWGALALRLRAIARTKAVNLELSRDDLFSSRRANRLLIYRSDISRHTAQAIAPWSGAEAEKNAICALRTVIHAADGLSEVFVIVPPDKRSVYREWTQDALPEKAVDFLRTLPGSLSGRYIDLLTPLDAAVQSGVRDVYLPNDTHWSAVGHEIVAERVLIRMK
ncbi:hypothetical protein U5922_014465 [Aquicoccus sp. G2-2]|uniref:alginate O-acetyltransferase AlgX-related protein n=1 Tax=Aquicoccus sp. G2-2 TaxID=3092120 RepID=UPI003670EC6A